jgi:DNA (cytosine-5)-methyltransferase 1
MNYYNEIDPYAAQWLRNLIDAGHIAPGIVDERSITDVKPADLAGYTQCHFFAGIGVWSHALRQSGWPDSRPVWTGSCPCQPFSTAGNQKGTADERHLWPVWFNLIRECRPPVVFGEQVEAAIRHGWLDLVQADLEGEDYACGAVGIPAAGVGAPHIRQRLYFVANTFGSNEQQRSKDVGKTQFIGRGSIDSELADDIDAGSQGRLPGGAYERRQDQHGHAGCDGAVSGLANTQSDREHTVGGIFEGPYKSESIGMPNFWADCDWLPCRDGKYRPVEPSTFPLAHGATARVGRLRAYGNAIVPQAAQALIEAYLET